MEVYYIIFELKKAIFQIQARKISLNSLEK